MTLTEQLTASIQLQREKLKAETAGKHLCNFLCEFEGKWDSDEKCDSPEIAQNYIDAATFMQHQYDRKENRVRQVQEWINNYLPY